jgi:hypothetical protein
MYCIIFGPMIAYWSKIGTTLEISLLLFRTRRETFGPRSFVALRLPIAPPN